jgi:hypothetical protein
MHWHISQFPELDHLEPDQRAHVLRQVPWWTYPIVIARAVIPSLVVGAIAGVWMADTLRWYAAALVLPIAVALAAGLYGYQLARVRSIMRRVIADGFRGERMPFCFKCGYDLRGLASIRCPECGSDVHDAPAA